MSCDICGRSSCANWMHSPEEQERFAKAIEAFEKAREIRQQIRDEERSEPDEFPDGSVTDRGPLSP